MPAIAGVVGALAGAYGAHEQAQAANRSRSASTNSTSTQVPYMAPNINPGLEDVINLQRGIVQRGAPQIGPNGQVTYAPLSGQESYDGGAPAGGTGGAAGGRRPSSNRPTTWTNARGETMTFNAQGQAVRAPAGTPAPGAGPGAGSGPPPAPAYDTPQSILSEVARRGLDAGNTPTVASARNVMANVWGAAGGPNAAGAGDPSRTGFEGYNPILNRLTGTLEGDVNSRRGQDLLLGFLGEDRRGGSASGNGQGQGSAEPTQYTPDGRPVATGGRFYDAGIAAANAAAANGGSGAGAGNANGVPDTMAAQSFFGDQTRKMFDDQGNDTELQSLIDAMNKDTQRGMYQDLATLDASAQGTGRFGGDMWKGLSGDARARAADEMTKGAAQVRVGDREARRQALLNALGQVNTRDLGLLGANVQREGIAASERSASAGASAASAGLQSQIDLARRGQDLSAIGELLGNERYSLGQLGQVGGQLSGDILGTVGMVPGLEGIGASGLNSALGAGGQFVDMRGQDTALRQAQIGAGTARAGLNQQAAMFNAGQQQDLVNNYLRTLAGIGGLGGTSTTNGVNVQPGAGVSPTGSALLGGLGGAATGYGLYQQYRNG